MSTICAYQFELEPADGQTAEQCLDAVTDLAATWVYGRFNAETPADYPFLFDGSTSALGEGGLDEVETDLRGLGDCRSSLLRWRSRFGPSPAGTRTVRFTAARDANAVAVALTVSAECEPFSLRQLPPRPASGHLVAGLGGLLSGLSGGWRCWAAGRRVPTRPTLLRSDATAAFTRDVLFDAGRVLPVLVFGPIDRGPPEGGPQFLDRWQDQLVGLAGVVALSRPAAHSLAEAVGPALACKPGEARLYWPGVSAADPPAGHWRCELGPPAQLDARLRGLYLLLADLSGRLFRPRGLIAAALAAQAGADPAELESFRRQRNAAAAERDGLAREAELARAELADLGRRRQDHARLAARLAEAEAAASELRRSRDTLRDERSAAAKRAHDAERELADLRARRLEPAPATPPAGDAADQSRAELELVWDENASLRVEAKAARRRADALADEVAKLRAALDGLGAVSAGSAADIPPADESAETEFDDVLSALRAAGDEFADVLSVWDDAVRSAEESSFPTPDQVYRALRAVAEVGRDYFRSLDGGPPVGPLDQAFRARVPFKYTAFESQTTLSMYGNERVFHHRDDKRLMQRHLTLGGGQTNHCLQIYFEFDGGRVLVGYCGRHLSFYTQRS